MGINMGIIVEGIVYKQVPLTVNERFTLVFAYIRPQNYSSTCDNTSDFSLVWLLIFII